VTVVLDGQSHAREVKVNHLGREQRCRISGVRALSSAVMTWTWRFEDAQGNVVEAPDVARGEFPSQSDAESWIGEYWRDLLAAGVDQVRLFEGNREVYGPMSLHPVE